MQFLIADTFTDSLVRLTGDEQKSVKTTVFDLQLNPASPGLSLHKLDRARDKNFWSVRVNRDVRVIVHRTPKSFLVCYVAHHDKAYEWAERRRLERHPSTGAIQWVETKETIHEVYVPSYVAKPNAAETPKLPFAALTDQQLLDYGVPADWLPQVRVATDESLLTLVDHLPAEAAEALLEIATGGTPKRDLSRAETAEITPPESPAPIVEQPVCEPCVDEVSESTTGSSDDVDPDALVASFEHPDSRRRFVAIADADELSRALDGPWDKWALFLHPDQRELVERQYAGPARVSGSAGTGKTIVAIHRAVHLARANPDARVLLTTFSDTLADALQVRVNRLVSHQPRLRERIDILSFHAVGLRLGKSHLGKVVLAKQDDVAQALRQAAQEVAGHKFSPQFLIAEWTEVIDAWQLTHWDAYRDMERLGRKKRLPEAQRLALWSIVDRARESLGAAGLTTESALFTHLAVAMARQPNRPYEHAVVDEAQDISVAQLKFLAALAGDREDGLFFSGDLGQRIFQSPFSWRSVGVDIRGRSHSLRVNYRTSHQIREHADRLLGRVVSDVDGNIEDRAGVVSAFSGPAPRIVVADDHEAEVTAVAAWLSETCDAGVPCHECAVVVRSADELDRAIAAVSRTKRPFKVLDQHATITTGHVSIVTMHLAKGLEFRAVAVMACDDEVIPSQARIETVGDDSDLEEVYDTERHLLYVACTRARDHLFVSGVRPASEFLDDIQDE